jgi:hypothetical protein
LNWHIFNWQQLLLPKSKFLCIAGKFAHQQLQRPWPLAMDEPFADAFKAVSIAICKGYFQSLLLLAGAGGERKQMGCHGFSSISG